MGFANLTIVGNLGGDPEMRYTANGSANTTFNVAVSHSKPDGQGGWNEETNWFRCTIWGKQGEAAAERLRKGNKVAVAGKFKSREYTDKNNVLRTSLEINVDSWQSLVPRAQQEEGSFGPETGPQQTTAAPAPVGNADIDDLPF